MAFGTVKVDSITTSTKTVTVDNLTENGLVAAAIGTTVQAFDADTAKTDTAQTFTAAQRGTITVLLPAATVTPDFAVSNNFSLELDQITLIENPGNLTAGQSGSIFLTQGSTGYTATWGSYWDFAGGTVPTLSAATKVDRIDYIVRSATSIHAVFTGDYS